MNWNHRILTVELKNSDLPGRAGAQPRGALVRPWERLAQCTRGRQSWERVQWISQRSDLGQKLNVTLFPFAQCTHLSEMRNNPPSSLVGPED